MADPLSRRVHAVFVVLALIAISACDDTPAPESALEGGHAVARAATPDRPSVLLVVIDTLRADAVSAYGEVEGTTPTLDALAERGLRYQRAFAPAPWTLPSHASLFTGRAVADHRVGMPERVDLDEGFVTLAERFAEAGYATAAFTENMLVSDVFDLLQGFDVRRYPGVYKVPTQDRPVAAKRWVDAAIEMAGWLAIREEKERPFFAFVNLMDAHAPYEVGEDNPFVPEGTSERELRALHPRPDTLLCDALPGDEELELMRALYLGQVARADARLAQMLRVARKAAGGRLLTVVTSDHGELFGERGLMGHFYSLDGALLRVPLVVHGVPGAEPAVLDAPVSLLDVAPSILAWSGLPVPDSMDGRLLPESGDDAPEKGRALSALYTDGYVLAPEAWEGVMGMNSGVMRRRCPETEPVYGAMASLRRFPWKLVWYEDYPPELFDLRWDTEQRSDVSEHHPEVVATLSEELRPRVEASGLLAEPGEPTSPEALRALEALGYLE